jgi:hypothetical protein
MTQALRKLIEIGGEVLGSANAMPDVASLASGTASIANELTALLAQKDGFYAFEAALHVFPWESRGPEIDLRAWNSPDLWISEYQGMASGCLFFAEDIFGGQFCAGESGIYQFDPETGEKTEIASRLDEWAEAILRDYRVLTGHQLAHQWQQLHGAIAPGFRLVPKVPFVAGGKFEIGNLYLLDAVKAMRLRASFAVQIRDLPDGAKISFKIGP